MKLFATALLLVPLLFGACSGDKVTQIVLAISTDIPLPRMNRIRLEAFSGDSKSSFTELAWDLTDQEPDPNATGTVNTLVRLPAYLGVLPGEAGSVSRPVRFVLQAFQIDNADPNKDVFVLERQAKLTFARDRTLLLRMALIGRCIGVKCGEDKSCGEQGCEDIEKKSDELPDYTEKGAKENPPGDGGPRDGFIVPADLKEKIPDRGADLKEPPTPDLGPQPDGPRADLRLDLIPKTDGPKVDGPKADMPVMPDMGSPDTLGPDMPQMPDMGSPDTQGPDMPQMPDMGSPDTQGPDMPQMPDMGPYDQGTDDGWWEPDMGPDDQGTDDGWGPEDGPTAADSPMSPDMP